MLHQYSPLLSKYNALWAKYGQQSTVRATQVIETEEDAITWSVKLNQALEAIARDQNKNLIDIVNAFILGVSTATQGADKLLAGLSKICVAQDVIQQHQLFFTFNDVDDLFLLDGEEKRSVMIFE